MATIFSCNTTAIPDPNHLYLIYDKTANPDATKPICIEYNSNLSRDALMFYIKKVLKKNPSDFSYHTLAKGTTEASNAQGYYLYAEKY